MMTSDEYAENAGACCPSCESIDISTTGALDPCDNIVAQDIVCEECGAEWVDIFRLVGYDNLETKEHPLKTLCRPMRDGI